MLPSYNKLRVYNRKHAKTTHLQIFWSSVYNSITIFLLKGSDNYVAQYQTETQFNEGNKKQSVTIHNKLVFNNLFLKLYKFKVKLHVFKTLKGFEYVKYNNFYTVTDKHSSAVSEISCHIVDLIEGNTLFPQGS